ncbi:MAG: flagellar export protein FliJ [Woeseiaceae bacterium]|nr:flagellar export protein FliJ [Woeseiaceae bacterium]
MLQSIAEHEERQQSKAFGAAQRKLADSEARLEELNLYRREYEGSIASRSGSSAIHWQEHHRFLQRLDEAIASQAAIVRDGRARREAHRRQWTLKRQRLESLTRVVERLEAADSRDAERLEQRESDECGNRLRPFGADA